MSHDLALAVDPQWKGGAGRGIIDRGVKSVDVEEAAGATGAGAVVIADNLARGVDACWRGVGGGQGTVEGGVETVDVEETVILEAVGGLFIARADDVA